jgi:hypothetical protein
MFLGSTPGISISAVISFSVSYKSILGVLNVSSSMDLIHSSSKNLSILNCLKELKPYF